MRILTVLFTLVAPVLASAASTDFKNSSWRSAVEGVVKQKLSSFGKASDRNELCPGYDGASQNEKVACWVTLVRATVVYENNEENPGKVTPEPFGGNSVGLLMLSKNECPGARSEAALKNAEANLKCGTAKMAHLVGKFGRVEGKRGAGKYWSVLRKPYTYRTKKGKVLKLGKINQIKAITRNYRSSQTAKLGGSSSPSVADNYVPPQPVAGDPSPLPDTSQKVAEAPPPDSGSAIAPAVKKKPSRRPASTSTRRTARKPAPKARQSSDSPGELIRRSMSGQHF